MSVALRKESVDRKIMERRDHSRTVVALRKESVDRNALMLSCTIGPPLSLSARRAWIEIYIIKITEFTPAVALRKESVDRNINAK